MKASKVLIFMLCIVFGLSNALALEGSSYNTVNSEESQYLVNNGDGEFKFIDENAIKSLNNDSKVKVKKLDTDLYEILDSNILNENKEYNKLVKVNEDTLLRVKELRIDLLDIELVEEYIRDYDINTEMAKDIRNLSTKVQNEGSGIDRELIIYTPNFSRKSKENNVEGVVTPMALAPSTSYYYTGYNNQQYKDEIWFGINTPAWETVKEGYTTKNYFDVVLNNLSDFITSEGADYATGGAYSIMEIFFDNPVVTYPARSGDLWQAQLNETKWRKYTSINVWNDVTQQYQYLTRAISDRSRMFFTHYIYREYNQSQEYEEGPQETWTSTHYYETDKYAYLHQDILYYEYINRYSINNFTYFGSQN